MSTVTALPSKQRHMPAVWAYFVRPSVVTDTILGRTGTANETFTVVNKFRKELIEETGLDKDRFAAKDTGTHTGYCIILGSNMPWFPPVSPEVDEKVKQYLITKLGSQDKFVGPKWFRWYP